MKEIATYSLVLNSFDKTYGTNNNATFQVNWNDFLPAEYDQYKIKYSFFSNGGFYLDDEYPHITAQNIVATSHFTGTSGENHIHLTSFTGVVVGQCVYSDVSGLECCSKITKINRDVSNIELDSVLSETVSVASDISFYWNDINSNNSKQAIEKTLAENYDCSGNYYIKIIDTTGILFGMNILGQGFTTQTVVSVNGNTITISDAGTHDYTAAEKVKFGFLNPISFNNARIAIDLGTRSYSYDTASQTDSKNIGTIMRDYISDTYPSNSFYCQTEFNPPRTISRPTHNQIGVQIYNNNVFMGGITSYSAYSVLDKITTGVVGSYSSKNTNMNFLTDTTNIETTTTNEKTFADTNDMSDWILYIEFTPISNDV